MRKHKLFAVVFLGLSASSVFAADVKLTTGFDYSRGNYGGTEETTIVSVPVVATVTEGNAAFKVTVPYVKISGPKVDRDTGVVLSGQTSDEEGLGDVVAQASYTLHQGTVKTPSLDITGKVKLPTGDEARGLSSGHTDYSAQLDAYHRIGKVSPFATVGYKVLGSAPDQNLDNVWYGSVGGSYSLTAKTQTGISVDWRQAAQTGGNEQQEAMVFISHRLPQDYRLQTYAVKGLAEGSPDVGGGVMLSRTF